MQDEVRRLHRWSWLFIAFGTIRALIFPAIAAIFASGGVLLWRLDLFSLVFIVPVAVYAFVKQRVYSYHFTENELVVRDGLLTKNVRHISYERIHNVALVRNPVHRMLGVTSARIETAAGGKPEAVLRVLSLEAAEELRRYTLEDERKAANADESAASVADAPLLWIPDKELARLGLISNRGFIVVAAVLGALSQGNWWENWITEQDWPKFLESAWSRGPGWVRWLVESGSIGARVLLGIAMILIFLVLIRLLSMVWYLVKYSGFTLRRNGDDLRAEYGLLTQVSSVIPVHRIQLVTVTASLLHRWSDRASIDIETAGASQEGSDLTQQLAASGVKLTRQWLAPIVETERAAGLVREVMPEVDFETVEWKPIEARAVRRIVTRVALVVVPVTFGLTMILTFAPIPVQGWHGLWLPAIVLPLTWWITRLWVKGAGYALTDEAIYFRSGWPGRKTSAVRFANMQTVSMRQSPFDRRRRMANVAVDTAGAGTVGHRIQIPFLDAGVAESILDRLYAETCANEFRW